MNQVIFYTLEVDVQFTTRYLVYTIDENPSEVWEIIAEIFH